MAVKLYRCSGQWVKIKAHPCWRVEKALLDMGIEYERVPGPEQANCADRRHGPGPLPGDPVRGRQLVPGAVERDGADDPSGQADGARRPAGRAPSGRPAAAGGTLGRRGAIAQLGERLDRTQEVAGSSPASSTESDSRPLLA